jgi:hypothetical protein
MQALQPGIFRVGPDRGGQLVLGIFFQPTSWKIRAISIVGACAASFIRNNPRAMRYDISVDVIRPHIQKLLRCQPGRNVVREQAAGDRQITCSMRSSAQQDFTFATTA